MELEIKLGPDWVPKLLVISHERSGTHFLMNSLSMNFGYSANDNGHNQDERWIDLDVNIPVNFWYPESISEFLACTEGMPILNIFKSHHPVDFFLPVLADILKQFFILYISRNGADVMNSCYRHYNDLDWNAGPKVNSGEEYSKSQPCGGQLRYQTVQFPTCWDRWKSHVEGWITKVPLSLLNRIIYVNYEDLNENFERVIRYIAGRLGLDVPAIITRPNKFTNVISPNKEEFEKERRANDGQG